MESLKSGLPVPENRQAATDALTEQASAALDDITHALMNALNSVAATSELAKMLLAHDATEEAMQALARIEPECLRVAQLLRDGRQFMQFELDPQAESIDLSILMGSCADAFDGQVEIVATEELPSVCGDPRALRRAFTELLDNAFQAGARHVCVTLQHDTASHAVQLAFRDDGPGTSVPLTRAFDLFATSQPSQHSGVGLPLVARIVRAHGGTIDASNDASGATFKIELPTG